MYTTNSKGAATHTHTHTIVIANKPPKDRKWNHGKDNPK